MALDKATVVKIARLARVRVPKSGQEALVDELSEILGWIEQLGEVDTGDVVPMTSVVEVPLHRRDDVVTDCDRRDDVLANAPEKTAGFYTVPKVVE